MHNITCYIILSRLDWRTQWEIRQWHSQTEEDEQEEHRGRAQSASVDINKQWQVMVWQQWHRTRKVPQLNSSLSVCHRLASESADSDLDVQLHCSSSLEAEPEAAMLQPESPPLASAFAVTASFEEDVLDLKWRQSIRALICPPTHVLSQFFLKVFLGCVAFNLFIEL